MFIKRSDVCCYRMSFGYVLGEIGELIDEIKQFNMSEAYSEACDVYSCGMVWLSDVSGLDLYIVNNKSIKAWAKRWEWWRRWLNAHGLEFKAEYMRRGANYKRKAKRDWVLNEARKENYNG